LGQESKLITFTSIASSSKGNAYLVEAPGAAPLLLEAGLPIRALRERLNFGLSGLAGCLVSHEHLDHSKAVKDLLKAGVDVYLSMGTDEALMLNNHHRVHILKTGKTEVIGDPFGWTVMPFALIHDAREPLGFLIAYGDDRLLFIPDTEYAEPRFQGITIAAVECNHIEDMLSDNIVNGNLPSVVGRRVRRNHMSLKTVIDMLKANNLSRCRKIYLLHLSDGNSDEKRMVAEVQAATGIPTEAC